MSSVKNIRKIIMLVVTAVMVVLTVFLIPQLAPRPEVNLADVEYADTFVLDADVWYKLNPDDYEIIGESFAKEQKPRANSPTYYYAIRAFNNKEQSLYLATALSQSAKEAFDRDGALVSLSSRPIDLTDEQNDEQLEVLSEWSNNEEGWTILPMALASESQGLGIIMIVLLCIIDVLLVALTLREWRLDARRISVGSSKRG